MFGTLLGGLPRPTEARGDLDSAIELVVRAQEEGGLEPITDGRLRAADARRRAADGRLRDAASAELSTPAAAVDAWRSTQAMTDRAVKQALPGPFSLGADLALADELGEVAAALADAGCPLVEFEESGLDRLGDEAERRRFHDVHERLLERVTGTHLSLSIVGATPDPDAWATVLGLPYASLAVDLIAGPDSWNLVTRLAGERGVVAGVESGGEPDVPKEVLLWAAHYAASTQGRGMARVGLGSAGSWANLAWEIAVRKMRLLGGAARLATMPAGDELTRSMDPRAVSPRHAALGHDV
jgi:methionine synthase II (cobalamin-independent)